jgi:CubicO group peptidase (beta-lactamase class C family)
MGSIVHRKRHEDVRGALGTLSGAMASRLLSRMQMSHTARVLTIATLLASAVIASPARPAQSQDLDADLRIFERYVEALRRQLSVPGLSAAILDGGHPVWFRGFGFQDIDARVPATPDTVYDIASLTKTFTSTLIMQCVERGSLDLDTPISRYTTAIPEAGATVRHVLTHTSQGVPGSAYRYDGNRYAALTNVVGACAGRPFRQVLATDILDRAAMVGSVPGHDLDQPTDTLAALFDAPTLARYASVLRRLATPYASSNDGLSRTSFPPRDISASAGLLSSVVDLASYDAAIDAHVFLSADAQELAWTNAVSSTTGQRLPYALGWFVQQYNGTRLVWHYGLWPQYSALYLKVPERQLTLLLLANSAGLSDRFSLDAGDVTVSPFARVFLKVFVR